MMSIHWLLTTLKRFLKLSATLGIGVFLFALYLLFTENGSKTLLAIISELTPYQISYTEFSGYLARQADFKKLTLTGPNLQLHANSFSMRWTLSDLMRPIKSIQMLEANDLTLQYQGKKVRSDQMRSLLPFPFLVEHLTLNHAHFEIDDIQHDMTHLQLKRASSMDLESIEEIHYQGTFGQCDILLNQAIDAKWDLRFNDAPFLMPYVSGHVRSQGHIYLPKRKWRDLNNQVTIRVEGNRAHTQGYALNDYVMTISGTLANHQIHLKGKANATPFQTSLKGHLSAQKWHGAIHELFITHELSSSLGNSTGKFSIEWGQSNIVSTLDMMLGEKQPVQAKITISKEKAHSLSGTINASVEQIRTLGIFIPECRRIRGSATLRAELSGTINKPIYSGAIHFHQLRIMTPVLKSKAVFESLQLTLSKDKKLHAEGKGTFGSGYFYITGNGQLHQTKPFMNVHLKGENLLLSDTPEYYIVANPQLTFSLNEKGPSLTGTIFIPHAEIRSLKNPNAISPSEDVVIVKNKVSAEKPAPTYSLTKALTTNIAIVLGEKISYTGYGLTANAKGKLHIKQSPGQPMTAKGQISLHKGKYRAYGKKFDIAEGELMFTGGVIDNPTLNIRAERKINVSPSTKTFHVQNTIIAGVKFIGPLKNTRLEFYSSPAMSNADIISYLVVGQPQSQMNNAQAELLFQALSQLTLFSGNKRSDVQFDLAEQLKLDQFGFTKKENAMSSNKDNPLEDTLFTLGKQLSDRLYLHYSVGLVDSSNNVGLRYFMSKNVTLEASAGTEGTSADLVITLEGR